MCGITFICDKLGSETAVRYALTSIEQLQNRGYDSYGISYYDALGRKQEEANMHLSLCP